MKRKNKDKRMRREKKDKRMRKEAKIRIKGWEEKKKG